jgi:hypothetical protein
MTTNALILQAKRYAMRMIGIHVPTASTSADQAAPGAMHLGRTAPRPPSFYQVGRAARQPWKRRADLPPGGVSSHTRGLPGLSCSPAGVLGADKRPGAGETSPTREIGRGARR